MSREKLLMSRDAALLILNAEDENFYLIDDILTMATRWSLQYRLITKRLSDNKFFEAWYSVGATEYQDESPWENDDTVLFTEVFPVQKTITVYE